MSNAVTLWFAGKTVTIRFGNFATVSDGTRRQLLSNEAGRVLADELVASGWKKL